MAYQKKSEENLNKPNFIFYLADDQDKLDYGTYGNPNVHTPNVDKLASQGLKFNSAFTGQAICAPCRSQLFTGLYPLKNGTFINHVGSKKGLLSVTDLLGDAGYEVVIAGKLHVKPQSVYERDSYYEDEPCGGFDMDKAIPIDSIENFLMTVTKPFCLFITSHYPHGPYPKSEETSYKPEDIVVHPHNEKNDKKVDLGRKMGYYENIKKDNEMPGWVPDMVDSDASLSSSTLFVYSSDHGASGKFTVTDAGLNVPFIVRWPGVIPPDMSTEAVVHYTDVLPTFFDIAGADIPSYLDVKSFKELLQGTTDRHQKYVYGVANHQNQLIPYIFPTRLIRSETFAYIRNFNSIGNYGDDENINKFIKRAALKFNAPAEELYDTVNDPYQLNNLAKDTVCQEVKGDLNRKLSVWIAQQEDYLLDYKMPVIYASNTALDNPRRLNKIPEELVGILKDSEVLYRTKELDFPLLLTPIVALKDISLSDTILSLKLEETSKLNIDFVPTNVTEKTVYWWSSNPEVAKVNQEGQIVALTKGTTNIQTMSFDGHHIASCEVIIVKI
ncbi:sulfatase-like hydrolase/transferase [Flagellimonas sp. CMM7]|uniref:sulfatase-like hydrolase/transferase n=1 Tax=Flagellimonas sp. CMM7 TaxID=2654676 RepID=UPI0013D5E467|nr:sulfatase-like hydrolase/transferase [Flagellimonas sp. CMM7]UII78748.1 sulfatase-like hydrolase/transferase [Flagellimonas sp. CMM7]